MSSYLNFYLVPKKREGQTDEPKPLFLCSFSRSSDIYQSFNESISPVYIGNGDEPLYMELTSSLADNVVHDIKDDVERAENRLEKALHTYRELGISPTDDGMADIISTKEYIEEMKENLIEVRFIKTLVEEIDNGYNDFEKVLINID